MSFSHKVTSYVTKETIGDEDKHIAAEEGLFAFHTIKHKHFFRSMDRTSSVIRNLHVQKFSYGRTKCEAVVVNVLAPFDMQQILGELETVKYVTFMVRTRNHKSLKLSNKIIAFCGDNVNANFRGAARKGTNNVLAKLTTSDLKMNTRGIGCAAHILHNAFPTRADILPVDVEAIMNKIFQYFHIYTVRVEE
jgi:hypothetical protein